MSETRILVQQMERVIDCTDRVRIETLAQLTRFVVRKQMTVEEAVDLAWEFGSAFSRRMQTHLRETNAAADKEL